MEISIEKARSLSVQVLEKFGFNNTDSAAATEVILAGEMTGKASHGLVRLVNMKKMIDDGRVVVNQDKNEIVKETANSVLVDGKGKPGFMVAPFALEKALEKMADQKVGIVCGGATNESPAVGMIGHFARKAVEKNLIYLGFHNSMSYLVPHGAKKGVWGTNPITIGVPSTLGPVIWDCSSSKISVGEVIIAKRDGKQIPEGFGLDKEGNPSTDPSTILSGGILPFAGHKGSGMAMMVELLSGVLIHSSIRPDSQWNWGSFFILIDPTMFGDIDTYKQEVTKSIKMLKATPKANGVDEIFYPGEQSDRKYKQALKTGTIESSQSVYDELNAILGT